MNFKEMSVVTTVSLPMTNVEDSASKLNRLYPEFLVTATLI